MTGALAVGTAGVTGTVWTHENSISSDGNTSNVLLPDLLPDAQDLKTEFVSVTGTTPSLQGIFKYQPYTPQSPNVTNDPFDQVAVFYFLSSATPVQLFEV